MLLVSSSILIDMAYVHKVGMDRFSFLLMQEPCRIGSSHNRSAQPFGAKKQAVPNVVHAQYNTPIGLYSADNIANTYSTQTEGLQKEMAKCVSVVKLT